MYQFNFIQTFNSDFISTHYVENHFANSFQEHLFDKNNEDRVYNDGSCLNKNIATSALSSLNLWVGRRQSPGVERSQVT